MLVRICSDDQNWLARDLELTDDSDSEAESESNLTKNDNNSVSGKLFPATDPMRLSESSSDSDSGLKADMQLKVCIPVSNFSQ